MKMSLDTRSVDYKPVNIENKELRLLEIQTGRQFSDPLVSRLVNVRVTDAIEFVGLCALLRDSDDTSTEDVWVNGGKVFVPKTIGLALRNIRSVFLRDQGLLQTIPSNSSSSSSLPRHPAPSQKKPPRWLRHLLRGVRSILPDESTPRSAPLRVFLDCICMNLRDEAEAENRRAHLALAYGSAKITVGWLGPKDETSDLAVNIMRQLDAVWPPNFGDPQDKIDHPENYSPVLKWLEPVGALFDEDAKINGAMETGPMFTAIMKFLKRPFFLRTWIVEELTLSSFPAFLLGDEIVSWMQMLQWNRINEEFDKAGSQYVSKGVEAAVRKIVRMDLSIVHTLLDDFDRRRDKNDTRGMYRSTLPDSPGEARPTTSKSNSTSRKESMRSFR